MISYGYEIKNGELEIVEEEAMVVKKIFQQYAMGKSLNEIAKELTEKKIAYYKENYQWNKNRIKRILENEKYVGFDKYPPILSSKEYEKVQIVKKDKELKKTELSKEIQYLKTLVKCKECGSLYYRNSCGRWHCKNKCKSEFYLADSNLIASILKGGKQMIEKPKILDSCQEERPFQDSIETQKYLHEINRKMNDQDKNNQLIKRLIMQYASSRFDNCVEDLSVYSNYLLENSKLLMTQQQKLAQYVKDNIIYLEIDKEEIQIHYINGLSILVKEGKNE